MKDVAEKLILALKEAASVLGLNGCHEAQDRARDAISEAERAMIVAALKEGEAAMKQKGTCRHEDEARAREVMAELDRQNSTITHQDPSLPRNSGS